MCIHANAQTHVHILHMHTLVHTHTHLHTCIHRCTHIHSPHLSLSFPQRWPQTCMLSLCILPGISPVHPGLSTHGWAFPAYSAGTQTRLYLLDEWISSFFRKMGQHWAWLHFCVSSLAVVSVLSPGKTHVPSSSHLRDPWAAPPRFQAVCVDLPYAHAW